MPPDAAASARDDGNLAGKPHEISFVFRGYNRVLPEGPMTSHPLRSRNWFGRQDLDGFVHRSWLKSEGFSITSSTASRSSASANLAGRS